MKPFVKTVPPGESGVGSGSLLEPFLLFLSKGRFWVFLKFSFRCHRQSVSTLGFPPRRNLGLQASIDANVA
jgi:hypothetical protein